MAQNYFRVAKGFEFEGIQILSGAGVPSTVDANAAGVNSLYIDTTNNEMYQKHTVGSGADKWERKARADEVAAALAESSWREPADIHDASVTTVALALSDMDTDDDIDGVAVVAGQRILLSGLSSESKNVYIVGGSTGAWTLTEDTNTLTAGDRIYVTGGTLAGKTYTYNGTAWVQSNQADIDELGFLRAFVGKTGAGSETPTYSTQNYITNGDSLETAAGKLDARAKTNADNISTNTSDISTNAGNITTNSNNITTLQGEQSTQNTNISNNASAISTLQTNDGIQDTNISNNASAITDLQTDVGDPANYSSNTIVTDGDSLVVAVGKLDSAIADRITKATAASVTTATTVDSVAVDSYFSAEWKVTCSKVSNPSDRESLIISATHDGDTADATEVDWTEYARKDVGGTIAGLDFDVVLAGTGAGQTMGLQVTSTDAVDVRVVRIAS